MILQTGEKMSDIFDMKIVSKIKNLLSREQVLENIKKLSAG